jgi:hypothetical protein
MSAYRFSESFFFSTGASNVKPSKNQGMTMLSVTRRGQLAVPARDMEGHRGVEPDLPARRSRCTS